MDSISVNKVTLTSNSQAWLVCISATMYFSYVIFQMSSFNTLSGELMHSFAINTAQLGNLSACYFYAGAICLIPAGVLLDQISIRKLLLFTMALCVLSTILFGVTSSMLIAGLCRATMGISNAFAFLGCMCLASSWFPPQRTALVMGLVITLGMAGGIVAQIPLTFLLSLVNWRQAVLISAIFGVFFWLIMCFFIEDREIRVKTSIDLYQLKENLKAGFSNSQNWFCGIYTSLLNLTILLLGALWGNLYLIHTQHLSSAKASLVTSMIFWGLIIGAPVAGMLSDWLSVRRLPMMLGAFFSLLVILLIIFITDWSWQMLAIWFLLLGFLSSAQAISYPTVAESNPTEITCTAMSIVSVLINLAAAISQPLFGWLVQWHTQEFAKVETRADPAISSYQFALILLPLAFLVSLIAVYRIRETYGKSHYS